MAIVIADKERKVNISNYFVAMGSIMIIIMLCFNLKLEKRARPKDWPKTGSGIKIKNQIKDQIKGR